MGKAASELRQLNRATMVQLVTAELDRLYTAYKPAFEYRFRHIDLLSAFMWVGASEKSPFKGMMHPGVRVAGTFEREFNSMFNLSETMSNLGRTLPMGRSPEDDLRQNLLVAAQTYDRGASTILYQTHNQDQALTVNIRRALLLLPQRKFKAGDKVVVLKPLRPSSSSSDAVVGAIGVVAQQQEPDSPGCTAVLPSGAEAPVLVTTSQLLLVEQRAPREGDYVVLHSLQQKPELIGRLARVLEMPKPTGTAAAGSSSSSSSGESAVPKHNPGDRCRVILVPWSVLGAAAATTSSSSNDQQQQQQRQQDVVAPKLSCITAVQQPVAALLVAFAAHNSKTPAASAAARRFMESQAQHLFPIANVRTTRREQAMMEGYMVKCASLLAPCSETLEQQLLSQLEPKHWTLGLMIPIKQPLSAAEQQRKTLKKELECRCCGRQGTKLQPLRACNSCKAAVYCSRDCQVADWKSHKQECKQGTAAAASSGNAATNASGGGNSSSGGGRAAGTSVGGEETPGSVLIPLGKLPSKSPLQGAGSCMLLTDGTIFNPHKIPKNIHGSREFLVKLQNASAQGALARAAMLSRDPNAAVQDSDEITLYDQPRSLMAFAAAGQAGHAEMLRVLRSVGRPGRMCPATRVAYAWAKREGPQLRVFVGRLPEQQQPW